MKIKFDWDDKLIKKYKRFNKTIDIFIMTIAVRAIFCENYKYYPQVSLDEGLYKI